MKDMMRRLFGGGKSSATSTSQNLPKKSSEPITVDRSKQQAEVDQRVAAISREKDAEALVTLALTDKSAVVRMTAAERLSDPSHLEKLRRESNDKNVQRHAREALKALRAQEQQQEAQQQRIGQLLGSITQHAARSWEPLYEARIDALLESWQSVSASASTDEQERFAEALALARDTVQRHAAEQAARVGAIAAKQEMIGACSELESLVQRLAHENLTDSLPAVSALRNVQQTRWDESLLQIPADAPLLARFRVAANYLDRWLLAATELARSAPELAALREPIADSESGALYEALDAIEARIDNLRARVDWPTGALLPPALEDLEQLARQLTEQRRSLQADIRAQLSQLHKRRGALRHMIAEGQLRVAVRTHQWLEKRITELPPREAAKEKASLAPLTDALAKLHDWYEFASTPKKEELCVAIESMTADAGDIQVRAEAIRDLRARWNTLCSADPDADPELRARFDRAVNLAWAPCAAWYDAQRKIQDDNLAARHNCCAQWEAALATLPTDVTAWRTRERLEREWHSQWKSLTPVRWPEARDSQDRFRKLLGQLRDQLRVERERGVASRRVLIERAVALQTQEPLDAALSATKTLSNDWKQCGWTDARDDRALWQEFRAALDAVFARRDAARDAEREARAIAAAAEAQRRADEQAKREQKIVETRAKRQSEITIAMAIAEAEAAHAIGQNIDLEALATQLAALPAKSTLAPALQTRIEKLKNSMPADAQALAANAEKLATLTLKLEILLDAPSPPELATLRMQAKVAQLNAALRQRNTHDDDPRRTLEDAWLSVGPLTPDARAPLLARWHALPPID